MTTLQIVFAVLGVALTTAGLIAGAMWKMFVHFTDGTVPEFGEVRREIGDLRIEMIGEVGGVRGEISGVRGEIGDLRTEMIGEFGGVRGEIGDLRTEMIGEISELRSELRCEIADLRAETRNGFRRIDARIDNLEQRVGSLLGPNSPIAQR